MTVGRPAGVASPGLRLALLRSVTKVAHICFLAAVGLGASPALAINGACTFQAKGLSLDFGTLDPSTAVTVTRPAVAATLSADMVGSCKDVTTMTVNADNGLYFSGSRRMTNGTDFIPYTLSLPITLPGQPNNKFIQFRFDGTVLGASYQNASFGTYGDTVTVTVTP